MKNISVCLLGPDGSGKSTIVKELNKKLNYRLCYLGYGESRRYFFSNLIKYKVDSSIFRIIGRLSTTLDDFIKLFSYVKFNKTGVIIDRFPSDNVVNTTLDFRKSIVYHKFIFWLIPKPDIFILLVGDPKILYERKKEISTDRINSYIELYREFLIKNDVNFVEINTTELNIETCVKMISEKINEI